MSKPEFKNYCLLKNGEVRTCYKYDYKARAFDYSAPNVMERGDHYVYVEPLGLDLFGASVLYEIEKFADNIEDLAK